jgi:hypothetical protein
VAAKDMASGEYDLYVLFATRYRWTPEQVNALDPHYIEELLAYQAAEARYDEQKQKEAEQKARAGRGGR